jgi:beta-glucuronidase
LWRFRFDAGGEGMTEGWWRGPLRGEREMAVPASYKHLVTDAAEREHVGEVLDHETGLRVHDRT